MEIAQAAVFDTVSIDLIYGLRDQPFGGLARSLENAVALNPVHLSCYQLNIHEGTPSGPAGAGKMSELPEAAQGDLFLFTHAFLKDAGIPGYEVSNFARSPEHRRGTTRNTGVTFPIWASAPRPTPSPARTAGGTSASSAPTKTFSKREGSRSPGAKS